MNIYAALNQMIEYIENHLEERIEYKNLAKFLGVNEYTLRRLFSLLCDTSLSEYIRKRRLSNAGYDLAYHKSKVIDVAIKYQYENAASFSRSFEKFHGIKPSMVKKDPQGLKNFPKLVFNEKIKSQEKIEYKIVELDSFHIYGLGKKTTNQTIERDAPIFFNKVCRKYKNKYGFPDYGMVSYQERFKSDNYEYWVLWKSKIDEFEKVSFPKSKWLVLLIPSQKAEDIRKVSQQFYYEFLPSCHFNLRSIPELEYYHDNITEFFIAIE